MTRKRLSDLLRTEQQKNHTHADEPLCEQTAAEEATTPTEAQEPQRTTRRSPTKADLEVTIAELKVQLSEAQQASAAYQQASAQARARIEELERQLAAAHKTPADSLHQLQAKLDAVQQEALQLAQANSRLLEEIKSLKQEPSPTKPTAAIRPVVPKPIPASRPRLSVPTAEPTDAQIPDWML
ncbi:hypothetical protein [Gloeobacter violaceus]|uniref:Glr2464 protein n=1 Tax=Gloeobacter violaceus (strain ATCC 29082 / PCC 7421) TaxID=251221 RepID=Q7NHS1_GLOVI|nr:hypothetical protein [Gloeobacter violaceus]BAC90405.1 glr2464 [Gloeobacter violaceus PCC 7421]